MESPTKKKKLTHNNFIIITEEENNIQQQLYGGHDLVRVILDDTLLESAMLKKKLRANKIRMLHTKFTHTEFSPTAPSRYESIRIIRTSQKLLFLGYVDCIHIYDIETLTFIRKVSLNRFIQDRIPAFEVDSMGEYLYLTPTKSITKIKLDSSEALWTVDIDVDYATLVESKDEIYIVNEEGLHILDINDGTVKKTILHKLENYTCSGIIHDEEEGMNYCSYRLADDMHQSDEPFYKLVIFNEESDEVTEIDHNEHISFISLMENYYICYSFWTAKLFEKNSNTCLIELEWPTTGFAMCSHFDNPSSTLWYSRTIDEGRFTTFDIEESIIDTPLNKEICNVLQKLGGKLPCFIQKSQVNNEFVIPECLKYLSSIEFKPCCFWFIDGEVQSIFSFDILRGWQEENETFAYEVCGKNVNDNKFCLFIKKSEVSNLSTGDFTIYLRHINESDCNFIKSWKLSEFITKVSRADSIKLEDNEYSIHFQKIYEQLLAQQIINPQSKEIDHSILFEQYQKTIWGQFGSLTHDAILEFVKYFKNSTIQFDHVDYKKIDLILLSEYCQPFCFIKL